MARRLVSSGSEFERIAGYSRAVVDGDTVHVSGTTGFDYAAGTIAEGLADQTRQAFANISTALEEAGFALRDVVRVRYYLTDAAEVEAFFPLCGAVFGDIRPAATCIICGLIDPRMKVEIEVTARRRKT
ncbi:MAG: RidA family protein [Inquilinaceae bacterium]